MAHSSGKNAQILIVDDTLENLNLLAIILTRQGYKVRKAISGKIALMGVENCLPDLILLDIKMPEMDGYAVCQQLKSSPRTKDIPVIFLSALDEVLDKVKAFKVGGVDYICKPFQIEEVLVRIENQLNLRQLQKELQTLNHHLEERVKERTIELEYMALHDSLIDLPNRTLFMRELSNALAQTQTNSNYHFAVMFLDCDRFKMVNDSLGHLVGDKLLILVSQRIANCLREDDLIARFGGDEFTILVSEVSHTETVINLAKTIHTALTLPFILQEHEIFLSVSIGIVWGDHQYKQPEHLLRDADIALYRAKLGGKARSEIFTPQMHLHIQQTMQLDMDLRRAMKQQEFLLEYQPIIALKSGELVSFEALVRWDHPKRGRVSPAEFIPSAEETGLILPLGLWVLEEACLQLCAWKKQIASINPNFERNLTISVNLSVSQFSQPNFIDDIDQILSKTGLDSQYLKLEITESAIMDNAQSATYILQELRKRSIQISIDDFGTGYSSLSYLHRFPVDTLKIDRSFVQQIDDSEGNWEIVKAIITLAQTLKMDLVAEGIETEKQKQQLQSLGCKLGQGYFFARPLSKEAAFDLICQNCQFFQRSQLETFQRTAFQKKVSQNEQLDSQ